MVNIDFSNIRAHDGSKDKGFEELVCQLAHLTHPDKARYFVRKEGDGGDAGVECYWKLNDDTEHAWQVKYFLDIITDNQWSQISESVKSALEKHPKLTKYYICLPRDWTDSRKVVKGKVVKSSWDKWVEHVKHWEELAQKKGMKVEFIHWCKHEISQLLQVDKPEFAGRALYWFNEPIINTEILKKIAEKSKKSLGERFTPEFHIDLPIANNFDCLGLTNKWKKQLRDKYDIVKKIRDDYKIIPKLPNNEIIWRKPSEEIEKFYTEFSNMLLENRFFERIETLKEVCETTYKSLKSSTDHIYDYLKNEKDEGVKKKLVNVNYDLFRLVAEIEDIRDLLEDNAISAGKNKALLLLGEAGTGKSHLLCDISLKRLEEGLPTVFLLGQHYAGGNPLDFICSELGIPDHPYRIVLGALDSLGESKNTRLLIVIDAINEGVNKEAWFDNIIQFLVELDSFPHIAVALSCRSTYKDFLIPQSDNKLVKINHYGFKGYEHRAALKYLAKQGISKPGTPILTPEFTNPLFLKTCCKAIKGLGQDKFPKGLNGFNKLYEFYIESIEQVINRKKRYRNSEHIVAEAVKKFVNELYPSYISGLPISKAREIIKEIDSKPNYGEDLFDLLVDEGVFSFDVIPIDTEKGRGIEIARFTYERFSDYAIAMHIIENCKTEEDIATLFLENGEIGKIINGNNKYKYAGIIEALGIGIPEKFSKEFLEFVHVEKYEYDWLFDKTFKDGILWRTSNSITPKSLDMLNSISYYGYHNQVLDVLLALSTEPEHPWNADFLDSNLVRMDMPERDAFWSTYIAINDSSENEYGEETVVRTLIDWSLHAELIGIEPERLRLVAIVLLWMTTTSNRRVRDQATKSLARILYYIPQEIVSFIEKFGNCDDAYLIERLYASIYGAVVHLGEDLIIKDIAVCVYNYQFKNNKPYPNILLRDYARGIIEYVYSKKLLDDIIDSPEIIRPPYTSKWPIENPSLSEIDKIAGDKFSSIKRSLLGYIGDFGNYTMNCVHYWSPTSISQKSPQTGIKLKQKFAKKLPDDLRIRYEKHLKDQVIKQKLMNKIDIQAWLEKLSEEAWKDTKFEEGKNIEDAWKQLKEDISNILDEVEKEEFRWINGLDTGDRPATFSRKWAQRWVCKKAYELGWKEELFAEFERIYSNGEGYGREGKKIERIGKKYQWIAFHELLARMSDNLIWNDRGYTDVNDHKFFGPWQIHKRDIDPTIWLRKTGDSRWSKWDKEFWWQPYIFPFTEDVLEEQIKWLWDRTIVPPLKDLLTIVNPDENKEWLVLHGFGNWEKKPLNNNKVVPSQNGWYRINSCIINKNDLEALKSDIKNKRLCDPCIVGIPSTGHQGYFGEFPWHPYYNDFVEWTYEGEIYDRDLNVKYHVPVCEYEWESGNVDHSIHEFIGFYMPSPKLINDLGLINDNINPGTWKSKSGELIFSDPSVVNEGPSYGLIRKDKIQYWLKENNLLLVWLIGGEKQLFTYDSSKFYGRLVFNAMFTLLDDEVKGEIWFEEER